MNRDSKIALITVILGTLALGTVACKKSETATSSTTTTTAQSSTTATVAPQPVTPTATTATTAAAPAPAGPVIASTEGEKQGVRIDITELKRTSGGTVNLKLAINNGMSDGLYIGNAWLGDGSLKDDHRGLGGIHLVDPVGKKKYFVVRDTENRCMCSREIADIPAGGRAVLWAKFPAPPPEVQKITIEIPHFQPIDDVTIQQ
jgi:hypothetical protein